MTKDDSITFLLKIISDLTSARILSEDKLGEKTFEAFSRMVNGFSRRGNSIYLPKRISLFKNISYLYTIFKLSTS